MNTPKRVLWKIAGGGIRTPTPEWAQDPKSSASASSATPATTEYFGFPCHLNEFVRTTHGLLVAGFPANCG